jgi:hypothetical protein
MAMGPADVNNRGQRVAAHHQREGQHHFHAIVVHALQQPIGNPADDESKHRSAHGFLDKQQPDVRRRRVLAGHRDFLHDDERHHANAVVEQRFPGDLKLQTVRHFRVFQNPDHRHRIGGRNQPAEQQAPRIAQVEPQPAERPMNQRAEDKHGYDHTRDGQRGDDTALRGQLVQIDVQRPGEQEKTQHPLHQRVVEINLGEQLHRAIANPGREMSGTDQPGRDQQGDQHHADRGRQFEAAVIQIAEQRRQRDEDRDDLKYGHWARG